MKSKYNEILDNEELRMERGFSNDSTMQYSFLKALIAIADELAELNDKIGQMYSWQESVAIWGTK